MAAVASVFVSDGSTAAGGAKAAGGDEKSTNAVQWSLLRLPDIAAGAYITSCSNGDGVVLSTTVRGRRFALKAEVLVHSAAPPDSALARERKVREHLGRNSNIASMFWYTELSLPAAEVLTAAAAASSADTTAEEAAAFARGLISALPADHSLRRRVADAASAGATLTLRLGVFEYGGKTMAGMSREGAVWDAATIANILAGIAAALHHCQSVGVVHRDVQPENILCMPDGRWVLNDFGSAALADPAELTVPVSRSNVPAPGSPAFTAPEVHEGIQAAIDGRATAIKYAKADVWSLGAVLFVLAHGSHPWPGATASARDRRRGTTQRLFAPQTL